MSVGSCLSVSRTRGQGKQSRRKLYVGIDVYRCRNRSPSTLTWGLPLHALGESAFDSFQRGG